MLSIILLAAYLIVINIVGFASMGIDKRRAIKRAFRIPEATLFLYALLGGALGSLLGMYVFNHKTRHPLFRIGMPVIIVLQIIFVTIIILSPLELIFI